MFFFNKNEPEKLVKKHFFFLVEEYGFDYTSFCYISEKVKITLEIGHKSPNISLLRLGEPDFSELDFRRIVQYFENRVLEIYFPNHSIEYNIKFMSGILKRYIPRIVNHIDEWWIPIHLFQYKLIEEDYKKSGQLEDFLRGFKREYDYLKSKGAI